MDRDLVVIGFGHAGCEAAYAAAKLGLRVLLCGLHLPRIAHMVCNPSIGGPGKAHLVSEIDAMGGLMGRIADATHLQARVLNASRGAAVRGLRLQADKKAYEALMRRTMEGTPGIDLSCALAAGIEAEAGRVAGVRFFGGGFCAAPRVVVATGVYLDSRIVRGEERYVAGPAGSATDGELSVSLRSLGFSTARLQTATPPRVWARSVDFSLLELLPFDPGTPLFSPESGGARDDARPCHVARAGMATVAAVRANLHRSPLVIGNIVNDGPRHCPSIDRKVIRFPDRFEHGVFVEPEGENGEELYLQGLSTAMAPESQLSVIRSLPGFAEAQVARFGYGIEYDFVPPHQLHPSLETRAVRGLYLAGQINGTSGYEEAAAQGLLAGLNAARTLRGRPPFVPSRALAYLGVLVDDLVTKEHREPYRMLPSRAEFRLTLAQESAHHRLTPLAYRLGLVGRERLERFRASRRRLFGAWRALERHEVTTAPAVQATLAELASPPIRKPVRALTLLSRPEIPFAALVRFGFAPPDPLTPAEERRIETEARQAGYVERERRTARELSRLERALLPADLDPDAIPSLSRGARAALERFRPDTLGRAGRLQGVTPADLARIAAWLSARRRGGSEESGKGP